MGGSFKAELKGFKTRDSVEFLAHSGYCNHMRYLMFMFTVIVLSPYGFATTVDCEARLKTSPMSLHALEKYPDGRWLATLDYSTEEPGVRKIELPAALAELKGSAKLKIVVLAGNSGEAYEHTRHSLAHSFGDYLLKIFKAKTHATDPKFLTRETVNVSYDDGTARSWTTDFRTQVPDYRTSSGEIFYFAEIGAAPVLMVKMIGDYNDAGDFAIPILDALELPAKNLILVHDDLTTPETSVQLSTGVQKYNGNNALFSLIRGLAYGAFPGMVEFLKSKADLPEERWVAFEKDFRDKANVRYKGHLGQDRAFDSAFKNVESILAGSTFLLPEIEDLLTRPLKRELEILRAQMSEMKRPMGPLMAELNNPGTTAPRKVELTVLRDELILKSKPVGDQIKATELKIGAVRKDLLAGLKAIIESRLTFSRLSIGTDNGAIDRTDLPGYVLAPFPREVFTDQVWGRVTMDLMNWAGK